VIGEAVAPTPILTPSELLTTTAMIVRFPWFQKNYWAKLRCRGGGPPFICIGRTIFYRESEVLAWIEGHRATSTSDARGRGGDGVVP
jgi:hypothetical protein